MRGYRITFNHKCSKWVIEFVKVHLVFFAIWTPAREAVAVEGGKEKFEIKTFDSSVQAYEFVKDRGIDKIYKDVTAGMPWEHAAQQQHQDTPITRGELAGMLKDILNADRQQIAARG